MNLLPITLAAIGGIALAAVGGGEAWPLVALPLAGAGLGYVLSGRSSLGVMLLLVCLAGGVGLARYEASRPTASSDLTALNDGMRTVRGYVANEPEERGASQRLVVQLTEIQGRDTWQPLSGAVLVTARPFPRFEYGDRLELRARLQTPPSFDDFDYREYLARQGIGSIASFPEIRRLEGKDGSAVQLWLSDLRRQLAEPLQQHLPEPESALARGMLLGQRSGIPNDLTQQLNRAGISHLVVISGSNVMLVATMTTGLLAWLIGRRWALVASMATVLLFAVLVGGSPPVLRASVMALVVLGAKLSGRPDDGARALLLTVAALCLWWPLLIEDVAFQLSVAATLGIARGAEPLAALWSGALRRVLPSALAAWIALSMGTTSAASLAVLPVSSFHFGSLSLVALPANLVAGLLFLPILALSALTALVGRASDVIGGFAGDLAYVPLHLFVLTGRFLGSRSFASVQFESGSWLLAAVAVAALGVVAWVLTARRGVEDEPVAATRFSWQQGLTILLLVVALWNARSLGGEAGESRLQVTFLDVGQGDAILIETPAGQRILIDGGPSGSRLLQELAAALPSGADSIDLVVLTHGQDDHVTGLVSVIERFEVDAVLEGPLAGETASYRAWRQVVADKRVPVVRAVAGTYSDLGGGVRLEVLHPGSETLRGTTDDLNNNAIVLRLIYGEVSFLLTGDVEAEAEARLVQYGDLEADVLKLGHHGSDGSSTEDFLAAVQPRVAVISVGATNPYGHPSPTTLLRLAGTPFFRTDLNGTVRFESDGRRLWADFESGQPRVVEPLAVD